MRAASRLLYHASAVLSALLVVGPGVCHGAEYQAGRGLSLFDDKLLIGGYGSVEASFLDDSRDHLFVDDLSTFVTLHITDRWLVFAEAELEEPVEIDSGGVHSGEHVFSLERLYGEWQPGDRFRMRVGQMLTPIGIWNRIHAEPLVWTTSRPIATDQFFDTGMTGVEATVFAPLAALDLSLTAFGQATPQIDETHDAQEARRAVGARIEAATATRWRAGFSVVRFRDHNDHRNETTFGIDAIWEARLVELSAELSLNDPDSASAMGAGYVQAVWHAGWRLHPFVRIEYADLGSFDRVPFVFGAAWKPTDTMVFKVEGILGADDTSLGGNGFLSSFAVLF